MKLSLAINLTPLPLPPPQKKRFSYLPYFSLYVSLKSARVLDWPRLSKWVVLEFFWLPWGNVFRKASLRLNNLTSKSNGKQLKLISLYHKSLHQNLSRLTQSTLFKIPDVNQRLKRRYGASAFQTIFNWVFGLVRSQHQFPSRQIDFSLRT